MFDMFKSAAKIASAAVDLPVSAAADVVTMGGVLTDRNKPYTTEAAERLVDNVKALAEPKSSSTNRADT